MKFALFMVLVCGPVLAYAEDTQDLHARLRNACTQDFARAPASVASEARYEWIQSHQDDFSPACQNAMNEVRDERTLQHMLIFSQPNWRR
jgi:hypothetical protein